MPMEKLGVKLYTLREVGEELGVSYTTVKNYHRHGRISGQRIGRNIYIAEEEIQKFLRGAGGQVMSNGSATK